MNGQSINQKPNTVQVIAVLAAAIIAWLLAFALMWCAMWKIYIDVPQLMAISNILSGIGGALTTVLVGKSIAQLNQPEEPISTLVQNPPTQPVPVAPQLSEENKNDVSTIS
jgi:hypothetical protein